jgi:hypothetical protein
MARGLRWVVPPTIAPAYLENSLVRGGLASLRDGPRESTVA